MAAARVSFNAIGWEAVRSEDVRLGHISEAMANAVAGLNPSSSISSSNSSTSGTVEYRFDYVSVKPIHRTHYVLLLISENARYDSHVLRTISHNAQLQQYAYIKATYVHPRIRLAELERAETQFRDPPDCLPALVIEVWSSESLQMRNIVHADSMTSDRDELVAPTLHKDMATISGSVMNPEGNSGIPPMRIRLLEKGEDRVGIRIPVHAHLRDYEREIVECMHKMMDKIHAASFDYPRERRTEVRRDQLYTYYTLTATNYSMPFTLEDFMSLYMTNMTQIKEIHYDCTTVSGTGERPIVRGSLVVKLTSNRHDTQAPCFGDASERQVAYRQTQPRLVFTLPNRVRITEPDITSVPLERPKPKRRMPEEAAVAAEQQQVSVQAVTEEQDQNKKRSKPNGDEVAAIASAPAAAAGAAPIKRSRSFRNLFGLLPAQQ